MMAALQRARMACNAAGLVDKETKGSPKLDELASIAQEGCQLAGQKAVVFSQWAQMGEMVKALVRRMGLGCVRLHGGVPSDKRGALMDRFHDDDACQVFISTDAGGTGLNLQCASLLVNLDIPWNPAVLDQRVARVHRLGQRHKVQVIHLMAADAYEDQVLGLVQGKRDLFDNVVDPEAEQDVVAMSKRLAEVLLRQACPATAAELLLGALLNAAALRCGQDQPPEPSHTAVWLYADALPAGLLQPDDATLIMRAQSLAQASDDVPPHLIAALAADAAAFIADMDNQP
jgi:superfamily II DNA or RNA helicase